MKQTSILTFFFASLIFVEAHAQTSSVLSGKELRDYRMHILESTLKEKLHLSGESENLFLKPGNLPESSGEHQISTGFPESELHAAMNPRDTSNIVTAAMDLGATLTFPIYYTSNFGSSWTHSSFHPSPYETNATVAGGGDPVFAYDANGKLYMTWIDLYTTAQPTDSAGWYLTTLHTGMYWAASTDGGKTFQRSANGYLASSVTKAAINFATGQQRVDSTTGFDDKEWIAVDRSNSVFRNTLYAAWVHISDPATGAGMSIVVGRKLPGVDSMERPVSVSGTSFLMVQYTAIVIDAQGGVHVTFMGTTDRQTYGIYQAYSSDGGKTFATPVLISDVDIPGVSPDAMGDAIFGIRPNGNYPCDHIAIDTAKTGNLYAVWNAVGIEQDEGHGTDIYFSRSTDNGKTWSDPSVINNDVVMGYTDHFYPSIAVDGKGMISVTWYDRREDPNNQIGRYYIAQSTNSGKSWTNAPVATKPMDFNQVMDVNKNFGIGEYTQVVAAPNYTIPFWSDGRDNFGRLRIYNALIPPGNASVNRVSTVSTGMELLANYPNPFSGTTQFGFKLGTPMHAKLVLTTVTGQRIKSFFNGIGTAGEHDFRFDASALAPGTYYLDLETDAGTIERAITILR